MKKKVKDSKKSAQSGILTAVLIILLVLVAIIILWNIVMPMIQNSSEDIDINPLTNTVSIESFRLYLNGDVNIRVKRDSGDQNIDSMQIVFYDVNGGRYVKTINNPPKAGEIIPYTIKASDIKANDKLNRVGVIPIINNRDGLEAKDISVVKKDSSGNIIPEIPANPGDIGLVSYWKFDSDMKDSVGGNNGNCTNCPILSADSKGNANSSYSFDGDEDYVNIPFNQDFNFTNKNLTISMWAKNLNPSADLDTFFGKGNPYNAAGIGYIITYGYPTDNYIGIVINDGTRRLNAVMSSDISGIINNWNHYIFIIDLGNTATSYVNGVYSGVKDISSKSSIDLSSSNFRIGTYGNAPGGNREWNGSIDDVMIFNKSLNSDEIKALYNSQK